MNSIDIVVVNFNTIDCIKLFYYSIKKYNQNINLNFIIRDNGSTDGSIEWLQSLKDITLDISDNSKHHGICLTELIKKYSHSDHVLISDSDIEFLQHGFILKMLEELKDDVFAVHIGNDHKDRIITPIEINYQDKQINHRINVIDINRVSPTLCLWNGNLLRRMLGYLTFGIYIGESSEVYYETSALIGDAFRGLGYKDILINRNGYVKHYESMTCFVVVGYLHNKMNIIHEKVKKYENRV